jgi:hypothetical protein
MLGVKAVSKGTEQSGVTTKKILFTKGFHIFSECDLALNVASGPQDDDEDLVPAPSTKNSIAVSPTPPKTPQVKVLLKCGLHSFF